jgi:hypothetical protein
MVGTQPAYFEVVSPEIIRVGVVPIAKLQLAKPEVTVEDVISSSSITSSLEMLERQKG